MIWVISALAGVVVGVVGAMLWMRSQLAEKRQAQHQKHQKALLQLEEDHRRRLQDATQSLRKEYENRLAASEELSQKHQEQIEAAIQASQHDADIHLQQTITELKQAHAEELTSTIQSLKQDHSLQLDNLRCTYEQRSQTAQPELESPIQNSEISLDQAATSDSLDLADENPLLTNTPMFGAAAFAVPAAFAAISELESPEPEMVQAPSESIAELAEFPVEIAEPEMFQAPVEEPAILDSEELVLEESDSMDFPDFNSAETPEATFLLDPPSAELPASTDPSLEDLFSGTFSSAVEAEPPIGLVETSDEIANPFELSDRTDHNFSDFANVPLDVEAEMPEAFFGMTAGVRDASDLDVMFAEVSETEAPESEASELFLDTPESVESEPLLFETAESAESIEWFTEASEFAQSESLEPEAFAAEANPQTNSFDDVDISQEPTLFSTASLDAEMDSELESLLPGPTTGHSPENVADVMSAIGLEDEVVHLAETPDLDAMLQSMSDSMSDVETEQSPVDWMDNLDASVEPEQSPADLMDDFAVAELEQSPANSLIDGLDGLFVSDDLDAVEAEQPSADLVIDGLDDLFVSDDVAALDESPSADGFNWDEDSALDLNLSEAGLGALDWDVDESTPAEMAISVNADLEIGEIDHTELTVQATLDAMILKERQAEEPNMSTVSPAQVSNTIVSLPQLKQLAGHADAEVRQEVAEQVLKMAEQRKLRAELKPVIPVLGRLSQDTMPQVRTQAVQALGQIQSFQVLPFLRRALRDTSPEVTQAAAIAIRQVKPVTSKAVKSAVKRTKR